MENYDCPRLATAMSSITLSLAITTGQVKAHTHGKTVRHVSVSMESSRQHFDSFFERSWHKKAGISSNIEVRALVTGPEGWCVFSVRLRLRTREVLTPAQRLLQRSVELLCPLHMDAVRGPIKPLRLIVTFAVLSVQQNSQRTLWNQIRRGYCSSGYKHSHLSSLTPPGVYQCVCITPSTAKFLPSPQTPQPSMCLQDRCANQMFPRRGERATDKPAVFVSPSRTKAVLCIWKSRVVCQMYWT